MKRETKKVKKPVKRVRKPVAKPIEEVKFIWHPPVALEQKKIDVKFPEVWNEEVARAAKVLGVDPLEVITELMAFLPGHYPNHLRMLEKIVEYETTVGSEKATRGFREAENAAYIAGRAAENSHHKHIANLVAEIQQRREIIEPSVCTCKPAF